MKCDAIKGMENWQPSCALAAGHDGNHVWKGPSLDDELRRIQDPVLAAPQSAGHYADDCTCPACCYLRKHPQLPRPADPVERMRLGNIRAWLEHQAIEHATERQVELYREGRLPQEEILQIARAVLFKPFGQFERWALSHERQKMIRQIRHVITCDPSYRDYDRSVEDGDGRFEPTGAEASNLAMLCAAALGAGQHPWLERTGGTVKVDPYTHWLSCTKCEGETSRSSAKVTITWGEHELVREYAL